MATSILPPGPKGTFLDGSWREYCRNPLDFLTQCAREYGDIVSFRFRRQRMLLLSHPDHIEYVLTTGQHHFNKGHNKKFSPLLGQGLFTTEQNVWLRQRRLAQFAFHRDRIAVHGDQIIAATERMLATWQDGATCDLHQELMRLMLEISARTILGLEDSREIADIGDSMATAVACLEHCEALGGWLPSWFPTSTRLRLREALRRLDTSLYRLIEERRSAKADGADLLSLLLRARLHSDGSQMTAREARDQVVNLLVAGRETSALALSWGWWLLANHLGVMSKLDHELEAVLGERLPTTADLPQLRYTERVVMEALRLFPPAFSLGRTAVDDCEIGGYRVPAGTRLILSQWVMHRDPRYFDNPHQFEPDRWSDGLAQRLPKFAYFPFGGGPRLCIGNTLAMMTVVLSLATIAQRFRIIPASGHEVTLSASVTLRPWNGIRVLLRARRRSSAAIEKRPSVSLCLIARNEEDNLRECLSSVATLVDEIVIVDTGSTDGTKSVAASFGARVVDFTWRDDFSAARNECLRHAAGDWLFWLDADERLDGANQSRLRFLLGELQTENVAYAMLQVSRPSDATSLPLSKTTVRLFRNDPQLQWRNRVHEQILPALWACGAEIRRVDVTIDHLGFQDANALRSKRDRDLYLLQLDDAEHPNDVGILFSLGRAFLDNAQPDKALPKLQRSLELAPPRDSIVRKLHVLISQAQGRLGQRADALATLRTGRRRFPNDPELLSTEALVLAEAGDSPQRKPR